MHYIPSAELAFSSVEHIMRDVWGGWFLRYLHANGASMFFLVVYLHVCRGLYYNSFYGKRQFVWYSGIIILFIMILTAFLGYVLPWGQMSFWAATVITSLASAIPLVGDSIVAWLWGGFSVGEQTLVRFFSLHYLLPFILFALVAAHIVLLHETGSNTPTGISLNWGDRITFGPYFFLKDLYFLVLFFILFMYFVFFNSNYLGHPDNYIPAMYMSTPAHIVPEWYFLPFYALLRSVPNKLGGVMVMLLSIVALALLPFLLNISSKKFILNSNFVPMRAVFFSLFVANSILLGWIGGQPIEEPMYTVGQISSIFYFFIIFIIFPIMNKLLDTNLSLYMKNLWWEDIFILIRQFFLPVEFLKNIIDKFNIFLERQWINAEYRLYKKGVHPDYQVDFLSKESFDDSRQGFYKNVILANEEFLSKKHLDWKKEFIEKRVNQVDFLINFTNANLETDNRKVNIQIFLEKIFLEKIESFKKTKIFQFFVNISPKEENIISSKVNLDNSQNSSLGHNLNHSNKN